MPGPAWSELAVPLADDTAARAAAAGDTWPLQLHLQRAGVAARLPRAVARPQSVDQVCELLAWCSSHDVCVVARGGGSGVCGGVLVDPGETREVLVADLTALAGVGPVRDGLVRVLAGTNGAVYEQMLSARGFTGGHYPQSLAISTVGGWLSCRGAGHASSRFGRAEDLVAGIEVVLADGSQVTLPARPATAAGPDMSALFCGSEGTLGIIVAATMRVFDAFSSPSFGSERFASFELGLDALRHSTAPVARLYDPADAAWTLRTEPVTTLLSVGPGSSGDPEPARAWWERRYEGVQTLRRVASREGQLGPHGLVDTMEVACGWECAAGLYEALRAALSRHCDAVLVHASHPASHSVCLYATMAFAGPGDAETSERYESAWAGGMAEVRRAGGTITHHHGVGRLRAAWLREELGGSGWRLLETLKVALDPGRILNPGNLGL